MIHVFAVGIIETMIVVKLIFCLYFNSLHD